MPTERDFEALLKRFHENTPRHFLTKVDYTNAGIGQVLLYLFKSPEPVSAGEIARHMDVSTARVAVLLKRMTEKNFIVKESDPLDARKSLVQLTETGKQAVDEILRQSYELMAKLTDKIGMERLNEFLDTLGEIHRISTEMFYPQETLRSQKEENT